MRVAVYQEDGSVFAYRLGRIIDDVDVVTGKSRTRDEIAASLVKQAKAEYPDADVVVEQLVDKGDESTWLGIE